MSAKQPRLTPGLARKLIAAGLRFGRSVVVDDGSPYGMRLCGMCGAQVQVIDSACWHCRGGKPRLEVVETRRRV